MQHQRPSNRSRPPARHRTPAPSHTCPVPRLSAAARREQLIGEATRLFSERGFGGTTTKEIAQAARITEALIFRHFPHKDDLYNAILEEKARDAGTDRWVDELRAAAETGDDIEVLRRLMSLIVTHGRQDPEFLRLMLYAALGRREMMREFRTRHMAPVYQEVLRFVKAGQRAGRFRPENPHAVARVLMGVPSYHAMLESLLGGDTLGNVGEDAADIYARMLLAALVTPVVGGTDEPGALIQKATQP